MNILGPLLTFWLLLAPRPTPYVMVNPSTVVFVSSPDHTTLWADGSQLVTGYELMYRRLDGTVIYREVIGKPTPDGKQQISVAISAQAKRYMSRGVSYTVVVITSGAGGSSNGPPSNEFKFTKL